MAYIDPDSYSALGPGLVKSQFANTVSNDTDDVQAEDAIQRIASLTPDDVAFPLTTEKEKEVKKRGKLGAPMSEFTGGSSSDEGANATLLEAQFNALNKRTNMSPEAARALMNPYDFYDPTAVVKSNLDESLSTNPKYVQEQRVRAINDQVRQSSLQNLWDNQALIWLNKGGDETITRSEAEKRAKELGIDIKFNSDNVSVFEFKTRAEQALKKQQLAKAVDHYYATGDVTFMQQAEIFLKSIGTGMFGTPLDASLSLVMLGAPDFIVSAAKGGAILAGAALNTRRMAQAGSVVARARTASTIVDAAVNGTADANLGAFARSMLSKNAAKNLSKIGYNLTRWSEGLEYGAMSWKEKMLVDAATFTTFDIPQAVAKKNLSQSLGIDLYTEKDMATEILLAGALGAVAPTAFRLVGNAFGIQPKALKLRKLKQLETDVKNKKALGNISEKEAEDRLKVIEQSRKEVEGVSESFKKQDKRITQMAEDIQKSNTSNDTLVRQLAYVRSEILQGRVPKLINMPQWESLLSHIDARILRGFLEGKSAVEVFGENLIRSVSKSGIVRALVSNETGLLGRANLGGASEAEVLAQLKNLYLGTVLHDENALAEFKLFAGSNEALIEGLSELLGKYKSFFAENIEAKKLGKKGRPASQLLNLKEKMEDIYMQSKLSEEEYSHWVDTGSLPAEKEYLEKNAKDLVDKYTISSTTKKGSTVYDFIDPITKEKDKGKALGKYLNELSDVSEGNKTLAKSMEVLEDYDVSRIQRELDRLENGLPMEDPDLNKMFGTEVVSIEEAKNLRNDSEYWNNVHERQRVELERTKEAEEYSRAFRALDKMPADKSGIYNDYSKAKRASDTIDALKKSGFVGFKQSMLEAIQGDEALKKAIVGILSGESVQKSTLYLRRRLPEVIKKSFAKAGLAGMDLKLGEISNRVVKIYLKTIEGNETLLKALLPAEERIKLDPRFAASGEELREGAASATESLDKTVSALERKKEILSSDLAKVKGKKARIKERKIAEIDEKIKSQKESYGKSIEEQQSKAAEIEKPKSEAIGEQFVAIQSVTQPLENLLNTELTRIQCQLTHDMDIRGRYLAEMMAHPAEAGEILTGRSSQTLTQYNGATRSVENIARTAYEYTTLLVNRLLQGKRGAELVEYFKTSSNTSDIAESIIKMTHGVTEGTENSNAQIVAKGILDMISTLNSTFRKFGSSFEASFNPLENRKFKYVDAVLPNDKVTQMQDLFSLKDYLSKEDFVESLKFTDKEGNTKIKFGDDVFDDFEGTAKAEAMYDEFIDAANSLFSITDERHKKLGLYVFRDCNLEEMFNKESHSLLDLNELRDAMLNGKMADYLKGDLERIYLATQSLNHIRTKLFGKAKISSNVVSTRSFTYQFLMGFTDFSSSASGKKPAYLDQVQTKLAFKDAESEMEAFKYFGYESTQEMLEANIDKLLKARYALEFFGSDPISLVQDLVNSYNSLLDGVTDVGEKFSREVRFLAEGTKEKDIKIAGAPKKLAGEIQSLTGGIKGKTFDMYKIPETARESMTYFAKYATGMQDRSASAAVQLVNTIRNIVGAPLLVKAGVGSIADFGTTWAGLVNNGLCSFLDSAKMYGRAARLWFSNRDAFRLISGASILEQQKLVQMMTNNPGADLVAVSRNASKLDKVVEGSNKWAEFWFNGMAQLGRITNFNKELAGMSVAMGIGDVSDTSYYSLERVLRNFLERDGITELEWDLIRKHLMIDMDSVIGTKKVFKKIFNPYQVDNIPEDELRKLLESRGVRNISAQDITDVRQEIMSKAFTLIDSPADEMISMPSERISYWLRMKNKKGGTAGTLMETLTQFQSFGMAIVHNTFGRALANGVDGYTGIRVVDMLLGRGGIGPWKKAAPYVLSSLVSVEIANLLAMEVRDRISGNQREWWSEDEGFNMELAGKRFFEGLGVIGTVLDTIWDTFDGASQGSSTVGVPSVSAVLRPVAAVKRAITSEDIRDKKTAVPATIANEALRPIKSAPLIGMVFQSMIGAYLDYLSKGGSRGYRRYLRNRRRRRFIPQPWEENPEPMGGFEEMRKDPTWMLR